MLLPSFKRKFCCYSKSFFNVCLANRCKKIFSLKILFLIFASLFFYKISLSKPKVNSSPIKVESKLNPDQTFDQQLFCKLPKLNLTGHKKSKKNIPCRLKAEWGFLKDLKWHFNQSVIANLTKLNCTYKSIYFVNDQRIGIRSGRELTEGALITDELIEVNCKAKSYSLSNNLIDKVYKNIHVQITNKMNLIEAKPLDKKSSSCKPLNILVLSYDSMSRVSWFKRLPKTTYYILNNLKATILYGHTIVGDGTFNNLTPLYTGKFPDELPSAHKYDPKGKYVDQVFPMIWKDLHKQGYMSFHFEDNPSFSPFAFRHRGFFNNTAHHYMRAYNLAVEKIKKYRPDDLCVGSIKRSKKALNLITEFIEMYNSKANYVALMHYGENTHGDNTRANHLDDDLESFLKHNFENGNLENTALLLFSDHGVRYNPDRQAGQGDLEERLPFFSVYLPEKFKQENRNKILNLVKNSNQFTTPLDIYQTIRHLACIKQDKHVHGIRSMSLLDQIPANRTCEHVGAPLHFCTCQSDWINLKRDDEFSKKAVADVLKEMNNLISQFEKYCETLVLKELKLVKYTNVYEGRLVRLQFVTKPNNGIYEATIVYDKNQNYFIEPVSSISRLNVYGFRTFCVPYFSQKFHITKDLRKFCFCKK